MDCVHGIRALSTQWVLLGHTYMMYLFMPTRNSLGFMMDVSGFLRLNVFYGEILHFRGVLPRAIILMSSLFQQFTVYERIS